MSVRTLLAAILVVAFVVTSVGFAPAQSRTVIDVSMTSFKFEPSVIRIREGDTVVLRLSNDDTQGRPHNIASAYFSDLELTVRGEARQGRTADGRRFIFVDAGKKAEVEFVARAWQTEEIAFACTITNHAARGMTGSFVVLPRQ
ncbi:MAG: cupredoxin domain-containing protein [Armatimonadota bacterium]|nr:cupredoxin domain-containing protein [Armatimonadota bacterium]MDR5696830.1 cupredoxin domain-containing protein [Armatimonadota bacterium]